MAGSTRSGGRGPAPRLAISGYQALLLLLFALFQVTLSFTLFTAGARLLPAKETALINAAEGPLSPFWVWLAFDEKPSAMTLASGVNARELARCVEMAIHGTKSAFPSMQPVDAFLKQLETMLRMLIAGAMAPSAKKSPRKTGVRK